MEGIINVYKEKGYTSFDVVAVLRGILQEKRIGHAGTLDPDAEGVLVVCCGHATKLVDMLTGHEKEYQAVLKLGIETDTLDTTGTILKENDVNVTEEEIRHAAASYTGDIMQLPPMYSAVKVGGKKLYELARAGREVERKPRKVNISEIRIEKIDIPFVTMTVRCSKGTYIRTLCDDIGHSLGCGGAMASLLRSRSGHFSVNDAKTIDEIRTEAAENSPTPSFLTPLDACFYDLPSVTVHERKDMLVRNGNAVRLKFKDFGEPVRNYPGNIRLLPPSEQAVRVYLEDGTFAGVYEYRQDQNIWRPWKMFITA